MAFVPAMWFASPQISETWPFCKKTERETEWRSKGDREKEKGNRKGGGEERGSRVVREPFSLYKAASPNLLGTSFTEDNFSINWGHGGDSSGSKASDGRWSSAPDLPFTSYYEAKTSTGLWRELGTPALKVREGNGTPLQYSCLENPMDGGAW